MTSGLNNTLPNGNHSHVSFYNGISIQEIAGREGTSSVDGSSSASKRYLLRGNPDPTVCRAALEDGPVPINKYDDMGLEGMDWELADNEQDWLFTCNYSQKVPDVGEFTVSIDTTGSMILQTSAYAQTAYAAPTMTAIDYGKSIDVQNGRPQGVQRVIPALKLNVRAKIATAYVTSPLTYSKMLSRLTGTLNNAALLDEGSGEIFDAGELLFLGSIGEPIGENPLLTFQFLASENATGLTIGDITGITKKGHDYIWYDFIDSKDTGTNRITRTPRAAYVSEIYGAADHSQMKIGVP